MAAYDTLRAAIDSYIKANGNKEITGTVLNDILNAMVSALGADTRFAGVAVPSTNPGNPEGNVVYFASQAGTYSNFGGIVLPLGIHILVWNGTAWTSQTWFSVDNTPTQYSQNLATSGGIFQAIVDAVGVERLRAIGVEVTSASFNSTTKKISFFNSANSTLFQLDATAFIIDGMVSDVKIENGNLVIKFNTDSGKQDIEIPLTDIFNPANYYTKTAIDTLLTLYYTKTETNALLTAINNKLADGCLYRGMAEPTTNPPTPTTKVFYIATKTGTYTNFGNISVTEGITILKYDGSNWSKEQISYSDGVFDISAYNGTSYADLSAALGTNGANIPQSLRKGGMSVKFVQSSDNRYVQYTLMTNSFSTTPSDWQGIGQEGPNMRIDLIAGTPQEEIDLDSYIENNYIISSNVWTNPSGYKCKLIYFKPYRGKTITVTANSNHNGDIAFLKNNNVVIGNSVNYCDSATREYIITKGDSSTFIVPSDCNYLYVYTLSGGTKVTTPESLIIQQYKGAISQLQDEIGICNDGILGNSNNIKNLNKLNNDRLFGVSNKDINFSFYPNTGYITSDGNWIIIQNYDSKVIPFAAYAGGLLTVTANNDYNTEIGFLKSNNLSAGAAIDYCQGYTGNKWIQKGTSISIEIPNDCAYLYIYILSNNRDVSPSVLKVIKSEGLFPVINDNKKVQKDDSDGFYVGSIINLKNYWKRETFRTTTLNIHQSFAIYNKYMITADYNGEGTALDGATCFGQIYDIETKQILGNLTFPFGNYNRPHANTICFGCEFAPGNTDLPLLYISSWDYENERGVFVYNVYKNNNVWTAELVQTIIPDIESITTAIIGAGATDWIVDTDEESLYSLAYYLAGPSTLVEGNKEMIVKFRLPKLSEGSLVTLTLSDVLDNYEERILNISQDKTYYKGKIYVISGLGQSYPNMSNLWVIDLLKKSIVSRIKLPLTWGELEGLSVYNDELLFDKGSTALYKFIF